IAIVGSGPAGFYTAEAFLRELPACCVDMFERQPAPYGLVRYGVAPDHQKLKQVTAVFDRIASDPRFALHANVAIGDVLTLAQLQARYHVVVLATGAPESRRLKIAGESLPNVFPSAAFVGWYNGHPDHTGLAPDFGAERACVVGNGNVALDVCRMLAR